jgi:penicillin-binding protein 2
VKRVGWRLAVTALLFGGLFGVLALRLWYLQVTAIASSLENAESQQIRTVSVEAPRGDILAADGLELLAGTKASLRVAVDRKLISEDQEEGLIQNLSALLGIGASEIRQQFDDEGFGARFTIGGEVPESVATFVLEHNEDFPGVVVEPVPLRTYPLGELAAHVIGYIGSPSPGDLERIDITPRDKVGRFGLERSYDAMLRGTPGTITYQVNAAGEILGVVDEVPPVPGGSVVTTIDIDLQQFLEQSLLEGMRLARTEGEPVVRAAGVVLDPRDGAVRAMASVPAFDPGLFVEGNISQEQWDALSEKAVFNNFAIQGLYPPASAFKVVAYTLALEDGIFPTLDVVYATRPEKIDEYRSLLDPNDPTSFFADGVLLFPNTPPLRDWTCEQFDVQLLSCWPPGHGLVNIHSALTRSSNQYFWGLALEIWEGRGLKWDENLFQDWAETLGFGAKTGIDLPFEQPGLVPDREWFSYHQANNTGLVRLEGPWSGGDLMNMAVGQGAMTATPLQMANAYAALLNGGTLWNPRVVDRIVDGDNDVLFTSPPAVLRRFEISDATVESLKADLHGVVAGEQGTARDAFSSFGDTLALVGGKTGTAETGQYRDLLDEQGQPVLNDEGEPRQEQITTAWFVGTAPLDDPEFVIAVVIEHGGSGGQIAAPTARRVMQFLMGEKLDKIEAGNVSER